MGCLRYPIAEVYLDQLKEHLKGDANIDKLLSSPIFKEDVDKAATDVILPEYAYDLGAKIVLETACQKPGQGILVFVGGMADIDNFVEHLYHVAASSGDCKKDGALPYGIEVLVLHSLVDLSNQAATLDACKGGQCGTQVVVATNIAESSLTLPNLTTVIDFGVHKEVTQITCVTH